MAILFGNRKYKYRVHKGLYYDVDLQMMSYLFETCVEYFKVKFSVDICRDRFIETFMLSNTRATMDECHPQLFGFSSWELLDRYCEYELNYDFSRFTLTEDDDLENDSWEMEGHWIGLMYVILHNFTGLSSREIYKKFDCKAARHAYYLGHEVAFSQCLDGLCEKYNWTSLLIERDGKDEIPGLD